MRRRELTRCCTAFAVGVAAWATGLAGSARAQAPPLVDPYDLPNAPRSLSLPELTHPDIEWTSTTAIGSVTSNAGHGAPELVERVAVEIPIGLRRWFAGAAYEMAGGGPIAHEGPSRIVGGNLELYGRTVWASRTGLAFGGGLGILPPLATFTRGAGGGDVALAAASLQPWDYSFFRVGAFTIHPFVDVRDLFGRFVVQFRQSFDWSFEVQDLSESGVTAASTLYLGWLASRLVGVGLEATEYYLIDDALPDAKRAKFIVAPNVRFLTPGIQPAIGAFASVGSPLAPAAESVWGLRFALTFVWDPRRPFFQDRME